MLSKSVTYRLLDSILAFMANIGMGFWVEKLQLGLFRWIKFVWYK